MNRLPKFVRCNSDRDVFVFHAAVPVCVGRVVVNGNTVNVVMERAYTQMHLADEAEMCVKMTKWYYNKYRAKEHINLIGSKNPIAPGVENLFTRMVVDRSRLSYTTGMSTEEFITANEELLKPLWEKNPDFRFNLQPAATLFVEQFCK